MDWIKIEISGDDSAFLASELKQTISAQFKLQPKVVKSDDCSECDGFLSYLPVSLMVPAAADIKEALEGVVEKALASFGYGAVSARVLC